MREQAIDALAPSCDPVIIKSLYERLEHPADHKWRQTVYQLAACGEAAVAARLIALLDATDDISSEDYDAPARWDARIARKLLLKLGEQAVPALQAMAHSDDSYLNRIREECRAILAELGYS